MADFTLRQFKEMSTIFKEGARGDTAYILKQGRVRISTMANGERIVLAELTPPTIFGEMALLSKDQVRTATAEAISQVEVIEIDKTKFDELMSQSSSIIALILQALTKRLVDTTSRVHKKSL
jgi:CRP/FNR family cyclic AMP-dependent transcriptional regulator